MATLLDSGKKPLARLGKKNSSGNEVSYVIFFGRFRSKKFPKKWPKMSLFGATFGSSKNWAGHGRNSLCSGPPPPGSGPGPGFPLAKNDWLQSSPPGWVGYANP